MVIANGDADDEYPSETFYVDLSNAVSGSLLLSKGRGTIIDSCTLEVVRGLALVRG